MVVERDGWGWWGDDCENMAAVHDGHVQTHGCWLLPPVTKIISEFDTSWPTFRVSILPTHSSLWMLLYSETSYVNRCFASLASLSALAVFTHAFL